MKTLTARFAALLALSTLSLSAVACDSIDPVADAEAGIAPMVAADIIDVEEATLQVKEADEDSRPGAEALLRAVELTDKGDEVEPRSYLEQEMVNYCFTVGSSAYSGQCVAPHLQLVSDWCIVLDTSLYSYGQAIPCSTI